MHPSVHGIFLLSKEKVTEAGQEIISYQHTDGPAAEMDWKTTWKFGTPLYLNQMRLLLEKIRIAKRLLRASPKR